MMKKVRKPEETNVKMTYLIVNLSPQNSEQSELFLHRFDQLHVSGAILQDLDGKDDFCSD
jgi:hypothetical protein